jgi:hypothetical protein
LPTDARSATSIRNTLASSTSASEAPKPHCCEFPNWLTIRFEYSVPSVPPIISGVT